MKGLKYLCSSKSLESKRVMPGFLQWYKARYTFPSPAPSHSPQQLISHCPLSSLNFQSLCLILEMESSITTVLNELVQVHELAKKLSHSLHQPTEIELCRAMAEEMMFSVEKVICMAKLTGSSRGQYGDTQQMSKKRKMMPTWTSQVSASTLRGAELPDDGYTWRKYGQKDILNAKHPRAYYRCTHRKKQGCLAMKQVQRSDDNPLVLEITYRGTHTCSSESNQSLFDQTYNRTMVDLQNNLKLKNESLNFEAKDSATSIIFPSTPLNPEEELFCSSPDLASCFLASFSSAFISPTTSESNCQPLSPCQKSSQGNSKADLTDIFYGNFYDELCNEGYGLHA